MTGHVVLCAICLDAFHTPVRRCCTNCDGTAASTWHTSRAAWRCSAKTRKGQQCRRAALPGRCCAAHTEQEPADAPAGQREASNRQPDDGARFR